MCTLPARVICSCSPESSSVPIVVSFCLPILIQDIFYRLNIFYTFYTLQMKERCALGIIFLSLCRREINVVERRDTVCFFLATLPATPPQFCPISRSPTHSQTTLRKQNTLRKETDRVQCRGKASSTYCQWARPIRPHATSSSTRSACTRVSFHN